MAKVDGDDIVSILEFFQDLEDPRSTINRRHLLGDLIVICIFAVTAGADGPRAISVWAKSNEEWLKRYLELPHGAPSRDTISRLLAALKPRAFQECFEAWIKAICKAKDIRDGLPDLNQISVDGKALRRSHDRKKNLKAMFMVSAWATQYGISLGQLATEEKSNEITAIPELIDQIEVKGAVVTIDAAGCQKEIAKQIIEAKGDYVLALKGNQGTLCNDVTDYMVKHMENDFKDITARKFEQVVKGHGRIDTLTYYQMKAPDCLTTKSQWSGLRTIGVAIRQSESKGKSTCEVRFYISSLKLSVKKFAAAVRGHWSIENTLHWCLDVTFREDENRTRNRHAADNLSWLRRFAISILKQQNDKESIAMRRRMAGWNVDYLAKVFGISRV